MEIKQFCFCKDPQGNLGMAIKYQNGLLTVRFGDSTREYRPNQLTFVKK